MQLREIQRLVTKIRFEFLKYASKKLEGKRAPKPPDMQADYDRLVKLLCDYFGVEENDRKL